MNDKKVIRKRYVAVAIVMAIVVIGAVALLSGHHRHEADVAEGVHTTYTCSMHPQIKQDKPGKCPICGMDLIPAKSGHESSHAMMQDNDAVMMSPEAMALANVETEVVGTGSADKSVRLFGKVQPDERLAQTQSAYVEGRIEQLYISAVGDRVTKGQTVARIYSPSLYAATQELVTAMQFPAGLQRQSLVAAATEKLRLLNISTAQINHIIKTGKASPYMELKANTGGTVVQKNVSTGDYVRQGQPLLKIANLSRVWVVFQAYESDLPFVRRGSVIHFTGEAIPGKTFTGRVSFIDPILDAKSRTAGVRVEMANPGGIFKPEMIVSGTAAAAVQQGSDHIIVPKSAVLWTGKRSVVYVKDEDNGQPIFRLREVTLGAALPGGYIVTDGLAEGEEIVTNGTFAVDATAQLDGRASMMNH